MACAHPVAARAVPRNPLDTGGRNDDDHAPGKHAPSTRQTDRGHREDQPLNDESLDDAELVRRCQAGDAAAWGVLVHRFQRLVYTIPRRAGLDESASADVFQLTFTRLYQHIASVQDGARVRAWLVTTARRESLRELKRAGRREGMTVSLDDPRPLPGGDRGDDDVHGGEVGAGDGAPDDPGEGASVAERLAAPAADGLCEEERWHEVQRAVERLEPRCRQLIELLFLTEPEPSYAEIGRRLGIPIGSIGPTRGRCLARLRKGLSDA